jgi:endonuclease III
VRADAVLVALRVHIPRPETELQFRDPFELLVAVVLSAQCTDARVNLVTPALFAAYPDAHALAAATPEDVFAHIRSVSYPNQKARHLVGAAQRLVAEHGGQVPGTREALEALPGVGRKTANVVLSVAFDEAALAVDTHVYRAAGWRTPSAP